MKNISIVFFAWLFACTSLFAQPSAVIVGPAKVPPGELTSLSSSGSQGDNLIWITPEGLSTIRAGCELMDQQIFFATTREGIYEFILVVSDKEASMSFARHTVVVASELPTPDPDPAPQPDPNPTPVPRKWDGLVDESRKAADKVNDSVTREAIKINVTRKLEELEARCNSGQCPTLLQAQTEVSSLLDTVIKLSANRFSEWSSWRLAISRYISQKGVVDLKDYLNAAKAYIAGL